MANRALLHKRYLEAFKLWLDNQLIGHRPGKGHYQVMQVQTERGWQVIYSREDMPEHYTVPDALVPLVRQFILEVRCTAAGS